MIDAHQAEDVIGTMGEAAFAEWLRDHPDFLKHDAGLLKKEMAAFCAGYRAAKHTPTQPQASSQSEHTALTSSQREAFYAARQELAARIQPQIEAIESSEKLRHDAKADLRTASGPSGGRFGESYAGSYRGSKDNPFIVPWRV